MLSLFQQKKFLFFKNQTLVQILILCSFILFLYACSGESGVSGESSTVELKGLVLAPTSESVTNQVFIDANQNFQLDANETAVNADPHTGQFQLEILALSPPQVNSLHLVVKQSSPYADRYLASPLSAYISAQPDGSFVSKTALISPLTSVVLNEMMSNHLTLQEAIQAIRDIANHEDVLGLVEIPSQSPANSQQTLQKLMQNWQVIQKNDLSTTALENFVNNAQLAKFQLNENTYNSDKKIQLAEELYQLEPKDQIELSTSASRYVVVYKNNINEKKLFITNQSVANEKISAQAIYANAQQLAHVYGATVGKTYTSALQGFSITVPMQNQEQFLQNIRNNPMVASVEKDAVIRLNNLAVNTQSPVVWGLDRVDQEALPLNNNYQYIYDGSGVNAYVLDTGVRSTHSEFIGRIKPGFSAIADGRGTTDCAGHGSHVSGIIGGRTYGVAKNVMITPVRVMDCNGGGSLSQLLAGIDWIVKNGKLPAVVNMSIGSNASDALDQAVANAVKAGFVFVTSAGNVAGDSCLQSPARSFEVINVGSSDNKDGKSYFSNYGECVDLFAPGSDIRSAWFNSDTEVHDLSGTSMSAPYVSGVVALYLQMNPKATPLQVRYALYNSANQNKMTGFIGNKSPNRLLLIGTQLNYAVAQKPKHVSPIVIVYRIVSVASIKYTKVKVSNTAWKVNAVITISSSNSGTLQLSNIFTSFSVGGSNLICITDVKGSCSVSSANIPNSIASTTFTVNTISGQSLAYLKRTNKLTSLTVKRP